MDTEEAGRAFPHARAGRLRIVVVRDQHVRRSRARRIRLLDPFHVGRRGEDRKHEAVGDRCRLRQSGRSFHSQIHRNALPDGRERQPGAHPLATHDLIDRLPGQQRSESFDVFDEPGDGLLEWDAQLPLHPRGVARTDADDEPAARELVECRTLHGGQGDMTRPRVDDAQADQDTGGRRSDTAGDRERAPLEVVLAQPQLRHSTFFGQPRHLDGLASVSGACGGDTDLHGRVPGRLASAVETASSNA